MPVSYTHLDVYKRQRFNKDEIKSGSDDAEGAAAKRRRAELAGGRGGSTWRTAGGDDEHDRRQPTCGESSRWGNAARCAAEDIDRIRHAQRGTECHVVSIPAVSYTHLDVYKRQDSGVGRVGA